MMKIMHLKFMLIYLEVLLQGSIQMMKELKELILKILLALKKLNKIPLKILLALMMKLVRFPQSHNQIEDSEVLEVLVIGAKHLEVFGQMQIWQLATTLWLY